MKYRLLSILVIRIGGRFRNLVLKFTLHSYITFRLFISTRKFEEFPGAKEEGIIKGMIRVNRSFFTELPLMRSEKESLALLE